MENKLKKRDKFHYTKRIISSYLSWLKPAIAQDTKFLTKEEKIKYLKANSVGFGISFRTIIRAARELGVETEEVYRVDTNKYKDL